MPKIELISDRHTECVADTGDKDPHERYRDYTLSIRAQLPSYISDEIVGEINRHAMRETVFKYSIGYNAFEKMGSAIFHYVDTDNGTATYALMFDQETCQVEDNPGEAYDKMLAEEEEDRERRLKKIKDRIRKAQVRNARKKQRADARKSQGEDDDD